MKLVVLVSISWRESVSMHAGFFVRGFMLRLEAHHSCTPVLLECMGQVVQPSACMPLCFSGQHIPYIACMKCLTTG